MTQRTCNIIMCCKGNDHYGYMADPIYSIKRYLGKACKFPWEKYTDDMIEDILFKALEDYIDEVPKPSSIINYMLDEFRANSIRSKLTNMRKTFTAKIISERIVNLFATASVRDDNGYINGFTEELIKQSEAEI